MMVLRFGAMILISAFLLTACGPDEDDILFDGHYFKTKLKTQRKAPLDFTVTAYPASASLLGARESARYEATIYCVNKYGRSDIIWTLGPVSPDEKLVISENTLIFKGSCRECHASQ